jgi:hypothetical protein
VKRGALGGYLTIFSAGIPVTARGRWNLLFLNNDKLACDLLGIAASSSAAYYRDPAAWYHVVMSCDTTLSSQRVKVYVNNSLSFTSDLFTQNEDTPVNSTNPHYIGQNIDTNEPFDGYLADINFVDGQALTPSSFGTTNSLGVWQPITYGGSYGTNGFYLPFPNSATGTAVSSSYLVVAGGGGGGSYAGGGGGGAGGLLSGSGMSLNANSSYTVVVGAGGVGGVNASPVATNGSLSSFNSIAPLGGGFGGGYYGSFSAGANGGSGGGAPYGGAGAGTGTSGQGNNGGSGSGGGLTYNGGGGGGGAGAVGGNANTSSGSPSGNGGAGSSSSISGASVTYAGGGGGGNFGGGTAGSGGAGGGGNGGTGGNGAAGTANRGGGGGGSGGSGSAGGAGGSGIVVVSYAGAPRYTGGTVTTSGGNTIHTFTSSGVLTSIFNDFSPQGNNWTGNNFDVTNTTASTYDSMTDVPTLTSATAANYAVMNPLNNNMGTSWNIASFQAANLNVGSAADNQNKVAVATMEMATGKFYWEVTIGSNFAATNTFLGMTQSNATGITKNVGIYYMNNGQKYINGTNSSYGVSYTTGDVIGFAYDADTGVLTCYKNNSSQGAIYSSGSGSSWMPTMAADNAGAGVTYYNSFNFGQRPFTYTPPSGFVALNTYNL